MAGANIRVLKRRIGSVQSNKKITRAMELIAASRIVKAQARVAAARPYADALAELVRRLAGSAEASHPMLAGRESVGTEGIVVISSDRGLAGSYNSNVIRLGEQLLAEARTQGRGNRLYVVGRKALSYFRYRGYTIRRTFEGVTDRPTYGDARAVANLIATDFVEGSVDKVTLVYTGFFSALTQRPASRQVLPIEPATAPGSARPAEGDQAAGRQGDFIFEPEPGAILERLLPRYLEATVFAALLDASASEHASRRRAMKAATDNADDLLKILTRQMNQARQAQITTEISEIVGGTEALAHQE